MPQQAEDEARGRSTRRERHAELVAPEVSRFVAEDMADGGMPTTTLRAYADANLDAKARDHAANRQRPR